MSFACLGPLEIFSVGFLALVSRSAGLAQPDCYHLLRVPHLAPAAAFELPVLELVHDALDRFLLRLGLMSRHWLTSRNSVIAENRSPAGIGSRPHALSLLPDTFWRQRNRLLAYLVGDGKVQLDGGCIGGVTNAASALERRCPAAPLLQQVGEPYDGSGTIALAAGNSHSRYYSALRVPRHLTDH
jgi:hypothetical protein